jgi:6-phosphogluconate dehydrogenase
MKNTQLHFFLHKMIASSDRNRCIALLILISAGEHRRIFTYCAGVVNLFDKESVMPRGDKSAYTDKQKRQAEHIEEGYEKKGVSAKEAKRRAWATENKISGGGKKSG